MSVYLSRKRWQEHGVLTLSAARDRAPGFGRGLWQKQQQRRKQPVQSRDVHENVLSKNGRVRRRRNNGIGVPSRCEAEVHYLKELLRLSTDEDLTFETASVENIRNWSSRISGINVSQLKKEEVDFVLLDEEYRYSPRDSLQLQVIEEETLELEKEEEDDDSECTRVELEPNFDSMGHLEEAHPVCYEPGSDDEKQKQPKKKKKRDAASCLKEEEELLWKKLKILLSAAFLARDDDEENNSEGGDHRNHGDEKEGKGVQTSKKNKGGVVTRRRKMLMLYAAYFELCPSHVFDSSTLQYPREENITKEGEEERRDQPTTLLEHKEESLCTLLEQKEESLYYKMQKAAMVKRVLQESMRLCPRDRIGLTPLAIAASASASIFPSAVFASFFPKKKTLYRSFSSSDFTTFSRKVIDRMLSLDPMAAKAPIMPSNELPLHLAVQSAKDWEDGVGSIYKAFPEAAAIPDGHRGWLPIHFAAASPSTPTAVISKLVHVYKNAASVRDVEGRLPLHLAAESCKTWDTGVGDIFSAFPEAAVMPDSKGRLPAYYLVSTTSSNTSMPCLNGSSKAALYNKSNHNAIPNKTKNASHPNANNKNKKDHTTTLVKAMLQNLVESRAMREVYEAEEEKRNCHYSKKSRSFYQSPNKLLFPFCGVGETLFFFDSPMLPFVTTYCRSGGSLSSTPSSSSVKSSTSSINRGNSIVHRYHQQRQPTQCDRDTSIGVR